MRKAFVFAAALAGAVLVSNAAPAAVIFSDLGPGNTYDCCNGIVEGGSGGGLGLLFEEGAGFTSPFDASVTQIDIALSNWVLGGVNSAEISLWTDNGGGLPGVQLGSWMISGMPTLGTTNNSPDMISGISGISLTGGASYILVAAPVSITDDSANVWNNNSQGISGLQPVNEGSGWFWGFATLPAFDILGTPTAAVPEPGTIALVIGGIAGAMRLRRRKAAK